MATTTKSSTNPGGLKSSHPPPGVPDGGTWGEVKYAGGNTNVLCVVLCLLGGIFTGCGACAYLCPLDKKDAYQIGDSVFDTRGHLVGKSKHVEFRPFAPHKRAAAEQAK